MASHLLRLMNEPLCSDPPRQAVHQLVGRMPIVRPVAATLCSCYHATGFTAMPRIQLMSRHSRIASSDTLPKSLTSTPEADGPHNS